MELILFLRVLLGVQFGVWKQAPFETTLVQNKFLKSQYFGQQNAYEDVGIH